MGNLYVISNDKRYIEELREQIDFSKCKDKYEHGYPICCSGSVAATIRGIRYRKEFDPEHDDFLVVYRNEDPYVTKLGSVEIIKYLARINSLNEQHYSIYCVDNIEDLQSYLDYIRLFIR